jgi:fructan beta-fructosidase
MKLCLVALLGFSLVGNAATDLVIADFEGADYAGWTAGGEAFGSAPARGALPGQMPVSGYEGKGLANSFLRGDDTTGVLTSPAFKIERRHIRFLIGGGNYPGETCINLFSSGRVIRTATGANSEHLEPHQWDVAEFAGQQVTLEIVDNRKGGWGHVNVDHIVQTDSPLPKTLENVTREVRAEKKYLNLPIKNGAPKRLMTITSDGKIVRQFTLELADGQPDWWAFLDLEPFRKQTLTLSVDKLKDDSKALSSIDQSDKIKDSENLYREKLRPQFHFTARRGWNNDPNGLVFYKGEFHLFYQHNPYGTQWGNMHWGHAVSRDLVHWEELDEALYPDEMGAMFSGSAVVDENNTAGFQKGSEKTLVAFYTAAGGDDPLSKGKRFTQCLAYSNDRGRTWIKYDKNPILGHIVGGNRDPKVLWYAPQNKWLMALYLDKNDFALFESKDLKSWNELQRFSIEGEIECPEFFELGNRWVFYGANGKYLIGSFDGKTFARESGPHELNYGNSFYASQTFNLPQSDKRRIMVPWGRFNIPDMPFNQMIGLPVELKLNQTAEGFRLSALPVDELKNLRGREIKLEQLKAGEFEIECSFDLGNKIDLNLHGAPIRYTPDDRKITCLGKTATLPRDAREVKIRALVDRATIDLFINDGALFMPMGYIPKNNDQTITVSKDGLKSLNAWPLKSAWK